MIRLLIVWLLSQFFLTHSYALDNQEIYKKLKTALAGRGDFATLAVTRSRKKEKTIEVEFMMSRELDFKTLPKILGNVFSYQKWVMPGINDNPNGGKFYVRFNSLDSDVKRPTDLLIKYALVLPFFKHIGKRWMKIKIAEENNVIVGNIVSYPKKKTVIKKVGGDFRAFRSENSPDRVWAYLKAYAVIGPWILYEGLPEILVRKELEPRVDIILRNYIDEEDRLLDQKS